MDFGGGYTVPRRKLGTPFQNPGWRYDALRNPHNYGFRKAFSRKNSEAGWLKRLIPRGLAYQQIYKIPKELKELKASLRPEEYAELVQLWRSNFKKTKQARLVFEGIEDYSNLYGWSSHAIKKLPDLWLQKLTSHVSSLEYHHDIYAALKIHLDSNYSQIKRYIGHLIFAGVSDVEIAKRWSLNRGDVTALRMLFFDFSAFPVDPVARWSLLVQLVNNGHIKEEEFALYKRVFELGELGLKAQVAAPYLLDDEKFQVKSYLYNSSLNHALHVHTATKTPKDVLIFNRVMGDMARLEYQKEETIKSRQEQKLLELQVKRLTKEAEDEIVSGMQSEDLVLIQSAITELAKQDGAPTHKSVFDLDMLT